MLHISEGNKIALSTKIWEFLEIFQFQTQDKSKITLFLIWEILQSFSGI